VAGHLKNSAMPKTSPMTGEMSASCLETGEAESVAVLALSPANRVRNAGSAYRDRPPSMAGGSCDVMVRDAARRAR